MNICADTVADPIDAGVATAIAAFADLERADLERAGLERIAHRRRVAELCRRTARHLGVKGPARLALVLAATEHSDGIRQVGGTLSSGVHVNAEIREGPFECLVAEMAEEILRFRHGMNGGALHSQLELAVGILDACDEFDDAVELAVLDRTSIPVAIGEFFDDVSPRFGAEILTALRDVTCRGLGREELLPALAEELPEFPAAALNLMRISDSASVAELQSIVASDRHLTRALVRTDVPLARKMLLSSCLGNLVAQRNSTGLREHSKVVAIHAHELAVECGYDRDIAFVAGMLHDIGRLVMQRYSASTRFDEEDLRSAGFPLTYAESLIHGTDHAVLGSSLLRKWNLPNEIVEAVAFHHSPENTKSVLAGILNLAEDAVLGMTSSGELRQSEAPWREMRRAAAARLTGIHRVSPNQTDQTSAIWSLAS